jgi:aldose 1-epimerase
MRAEVSNYGGIIKSLHVRDRNGTLRDVVLGFATLGEYEEHTGPYFGAIIGRYANRIGNGSKFTLEGHEYRLASNAKTGG